MELSTDRILGKVVDLSRGLVPAADRGVRCLDIGSGTGALIALMRRAHPNVETHACDYIDSLMKVPGQKVDIANLNQDDLPYPAETFDLVTCTEVIEHLENYRRLLREMFRVTKPGGAVILTTPNVLNLNSRLRFLSFGFWNLFGPLPVGRAETYSSIGHITPISYFYLAHALAESGFSLGDLAIDKPQRSAMPKLLVLWPFIALFGFLAKHREIRRYKTVDESNLKIVESLNSVKVLLGRTIVVVARRPG
ncbi:MAG: class I SAM-dependent methyltransferase [Gammaproteobacteria bacterium]|nr:class I SAM-dependent methyltransferase [Gammaproteobacteria bacterium]